MKHYMRLGEKRFEAEMVCGHPDIEGNNAASVGCKGNCAECHHGKATTDIKSMFALFKATGSVKR